MLQRVIIMLGEMNKRHRKNPLVNMCYYQRVANTYPMMMHSRDGWQIQKPEKLCPRIANTVHNL
jgi:hypothetical protein